MNAAKVIGWTGPEYLNYRVFYKAVGYLSDTVVRATSKDEAAAKVAATMPNFVAVTSVFDGR